MRRELRNFLWPAVACLSTAGAIFPVSNETHHLGVAGRPEWSHFREKTPEGSSLALRFEAQRNAKDYTLFIRQDDVKQDWTVNLNGQKLGQLFLMEADLVHTLRIPPGGLVDGQNELTFSTKTPEDILIHRVAIGDDSKEKLLTEGPVEIKVQDDRSGILIPARITIIDEAGALTPIHDFGATNLATRPGVIYTGSRSARIKLLPGTFQVYATRGPEYSFATVTNFNPALTPTLTLKLNRAADTAGWVASDTHIHTLSLSKHGDCLLSERMITLAGEGIELPISTEHNLHSDYSAAAKALGLDRYFTPVCGNEVTTKRGHFNIFPVDPNAKPPDANTEDWPALFWQIRATPNVQIVILNHPNDSHSGFTPFAVTNIHILTGRNLLGDYKFEFDAMELINSGAMRSEWGETFRVWFALLNRGYKVIGVGASDSHDVSRFIVGQGRTYIKVDDSDVAHIDVQKACESLKRGHAVVSLGLFPQMTLADSDDPGRAAGPGDLHLAQADELEFKITVAAPLANKNPHLTICANGVPAHEFYAVPTPFSTKVKRPRQDTYYVLIAEIPGDTAPQWGLARPYQPSSPRLNLKFIGVTNPIWVDADGDGKFTPPREYAQQLVNAGKGLGEAAKYDLPTLWQFAEIAKLTRAGASDANGRSILKDYFEVEEFISQSQRSP